MTTPSPLFPDLRLQTVAALLRAGQVQWRALGVTRIRIFGSVARGEATAASDIDLLLDFAPQPQSIQSQSTLAQPAPTQPGLLLLMQVKAVLENLLERRVDVVLESGLKPPLRGEILDDAIDIMQEPLPTPLLHREKRWRWRVFDLLEALDRIDEETHKLTFTTFLMSKQAQDATLLNMLRLGETTKFIPQSVQDKNPQIPWALLRDIRNLVAHDYFRIAPELIWQTARAELPTLRPKLQALADAEVEGGT